MEGREGGRKNGKEGLKNIRSNKKGKEKENGVHMPAGHRFWSTSLDYEA